MAVQSFENHKRNGVSFSGEELAALQEILAGKENPLTGKKLERFQAKISDGIQK